MIRIPMIRIPMIRIPMQDPPKCQYTLPELKYIILAIATDVVYTRRVTTEKRYTERKHAANCVTPIYSVYLL
jgi:hypothetical protein